MPVASKNLVKNYRNAALTLALAACAPALFAQSSIQVDTDPVDCLPIGENGAAYATVDNNVADTTVRLNFRRMHDTVEDLYWVGMNPAGQGRYWGVMPKAEDRPVQRHDVIERRENIQAETSWAEWWRQKDSSDHRDPNSELDTDLIRERASQGKQVERDWLGEMDDDTFQRWLEQLENEPAEYFTSVHDYNGDEIARSRTRVTEVKSNCRVDLTPEQLGEAENLTVGETAYWQRDESIFHWLCDGIVSRVDPTNVLRGDGICRACVVAWWKRKEILIPAIVGAGVVTGVVLLDDDDPDPISPSSP
ncbi:MAG: hypothetical protein AAGM22_00595 [Acidobacteriota bacterium]